MKYQIKETDSEKLLRSEVVNYNFDKKTGFMMTWGKTLENDPDLSPFGNFILDMEISTICKQNCKFCYKANTPNGKNMTFDTFKIILDKILESNKCLTQIAFGSGATGEENPDTWKIMDYCREKGIIPNITIANITDETADKLVNRCGAVAVSRYENKNMCYDSVKKLTDRGLTQTNIHQLICEETYDQAIETISNIKTDDRLKYLNAIVFLSLKQKGRAETGFTPLSQDKYKILIDKCFESKINFGFDSCGAMRFSDAIKDRKNKDQLNKMIEPCESGCFSFYINVDGEGFPCSFTDGYETWETGINIINCNDFVKDVWNNQRMIEFRNKLIKCKRNCILYTI